MVGISFTFRKYALLSLLLSRTPVPSSPDHHFQNDALNMHLRDFCKPDVVPKVDIEKWGEGGCCMSYQEIRISNTKVQIYVIVINRATMNILIMVSRSALLVIL